MEYIEANVHNIIVSVDPHLMFLLSLKTVSLSVELFFRFLQKHPLLTLLILCQKILR